MVADVQEPGLADSDELGIADAEIADASPEAEADPVAVLREELAAAKAELSELRGLRALNPEQINRALGHIPALQRDFAELKKSPVADPVAAIDPRLAESEDTLSDLVDALIASDLLDDGSKSALRQRRLRMDAGRTERDRVRLRRELLSEVQGARETVQEAQAPSPEAQMVLEVQNETVRLMGYAEAKEVDWAAIPADELQFKPGETLAQSAARVRKAIDGLASEAAVPERVGARRRAAGAGAPASNGANAFRSQREVDLAHMEGRLTSTQVTQMRRDGRYGALPY